MRMPPRAFISGCSGHRLTADETAFFRDADPWGLILFARNVGDAAQISRLTAEFRAAVSRADAPVLIDQEGGRVQRIKPPLAAAHVPAAVYGAMYAADPAGALAAVRLGAMLIGAELAELGITVDCLPVLDLQVEGADRIVGDRSYASDPRVVGALGRAATEGLLAAGVLPVVKHMPGHGRAGADSHISLPRVDTPRAVLEASDFLPFRAMADAPLAMTAHVLYESLDPERCATISPRVIAEIIRGWIGFDGALMSDDLSMQALGGTLGERAAASLDAGCDLVLHCNGKLDEMRAVADRTPRLAGDAARRAEAALARLAAPRPPVEIAALRNDYADAMAVVA